MDTIFVLLKKTSSFIANLRKQAGFRVCSLIIHAKSYLRCNRYH